MDIKSIARLPIGYKVARSPGVVEKTEEYLKANKLLRELDEYFWTLHAVRSIVPHTEESFWSGHFFPMIESTEELEVSFNLCCCGFYKQAMVSLRCALELGLLSVYWNIEDDGHLVIQDWLKSRDETPRFGEVWKKLEKHPNIRRFQVEHDLRSRLLNLSFLHDFVHSRGVRFSNRIGMANIGRQEFVEKGFTLWYGTFAEVTELISVLHVLKYPISIVRYDWEAKFGINKPFFGGLQEFEIDRVEKLLGVEYTATLREVSAGDPEVEGILESIDQLPDVTEEEVEEQIRWWDKEHIKGLGLRKWVEQEKALYGDRWESEKLQERVRILTEWAEENGLLEEPVQMEQNSRGPEGP